MKQLIRYRNRKIYDNQLHKTVNLKDILSLVLDGEKIVVTDYETGTDITAIILSQVLAEVVVKEKKVPVITLLEAILAAYKCIDETSQNNYTN